MYKSRLLYQNIVLSANNIIKSKKNGLSSVTNKIKIENVLVISKLSRYEYERIKFKNLNETEFERELTNRGTDYDKLLHHYQLHKSFEKKVIDVMRSEGFNIDIVNRLNYTEDKIQWADIIVPTGGDGTFLLAASRIRNNKKPVIGFNSDPNRSEGYLCVPKPYSYNVEEAIGRLKQGQFKWLLRSRIRTTVIDSEKKVVPKEPEEDSCKLQDGMCKKEHGTVLPALALNEVFMGECLSARVSHLEMTLNGSTQHTNMKCSGLCVCTGTGSTSWHLSINRLPVQSVAELLRLIDIEATEGKDSLATVLADIYNKNLIFNPDDKRMGYTIRDLISAGVWPQPKGIKSRGFASKIHVKSKCFDAYLVIDGGVSYVFNDGTIAILEINPEYALRTVVFPD